MRTTARDKHVTRLLTLGLVAVVLGACTTGPLRVKERYFVAVTDGVSTNYLRITVNGETEVSRAEFRQGWFPSVAVDRLFGDVSEAGEGKALLLREQLKKQIDDALLEADRNYRNLAKDPKTTPEDLRRALAATNRVLLMPKPGLGKLGGTMPMEYDPRRGLAVLHGDEKLVFLLSADPDQIVTSIAAFAAQADTEKTVQKLMGAIAPAINRDLLTKMSNATTARRIDADVVKQIDAALTALTGTVTREASLAEVERLLALLRTVQRTRP
jgi:hypothetical protein